MDVLIVFVALAAIVGLFVLWRARRPGPLPSTARASSPRDEDDERSAPPTLDRPAGPGAEAQAAPERGEMTGEAAAAESALPSDAERGREPGSG